MNPNLKFYYMCRRITNEKPSLILNEMSELFESDLVSAEDQLINTWEKEFMACKSKIQYSVLSYPISYEKKLFKNTSLVLNSQGNIKNIELYVLCRNQLKIDASKILAETRKIFGFKCAPSLGSLNDWISNNLCSQSEITSSEGNQINKTIKSNPFVSKGSQKNGQTHTKPKPERLNVQNESITNQNESEINDSKDESNSSLSTSCFKESLNERIINELKSRVKQLEKDNEKLLSKNRLHSCDSLSSGFEDQTNEQSFIKQIEIIKAENEVLKVKNKKLEKNQIKILTSQYDQIFKLQEINTLLEGRLKDKENEIKESRQKFELQNIEIFSKIDAYNQAGINELKNKCSHQEKKLRQSEDLLSIKDNEITKLKKEISLNFLILKDALDEFYNNEEEGSSPKNNDFCQQIERLKGILQSSSRNFGNLINQVNLLQNEIKMNTSGYTKEIQDLKHSNIRLAREKDEIEFQLRKHETPNKHQRNKDKENFLNQGWDNYNYKKRRFN